MKITVHAEGTRQEIASQLTAAANIYATAELAKAAKADAAATTTTKKSKAKVAEETEEEEEFDLGDAEEETDETEEEVEDEEEEVQTASLEDVIGAFQKYVKKNGRDKATAVLAKFKVKAVRDLKATQYESILKAVK